MAAEMKQSEVEYLEALKYNQVMQSIDIYFNVWVTS